MSGMALVDWRRKAARQIWPAFGRPALAARCVSGRAVGLAGLFATCLVCLLAALPSPSRPAAPRLPPTPAEAPSAAWLDTIKPIEIFHLETTELAKSVKTYISRRSLTGGGRQDTISVGTLGSDEPALRLRLYRRGSETYAPAPVFADVARLAAETGLSVARSGLPDLMTTRFGRFQVIEVALSAGTPPARPCSGFRLDSPALTVTGLVCGGKTAAMTRERLACVLERLDLAAGSDDSTLVAFFTAADLQRTPACTGMHYGADGLHAAGLDDRSATPRKNVRRH
jgi:hypothetical protein